MFFTGFYGPYTLIYRTSDGAQNWSSIPDTSDGFYNRLFMTNQSHAWIVGWKGSIYKGTSSTAAVRVIENLSTVEAFPNPAQSDCTIRMNLKNRAVMRIDLLNGAGANVRSIHKGMLPAGESNFNIDQFQNLVPGMYYARLQSEGGIQTVAVVKQ